MDYIEWKLWGKMMGGAFDTKVPEPSREENDSQAKFRVSQSDSSLNIRLYQAVIDNI